ncbi:MAG TPA: DNA adenine methylase [Fimbriimonadaceae bacterium]|jgi:DNA adenine methylase
MRFDSPLRYPGGKGKILNFIRLVFQENSLVGRDYIEPYAGGAAVALGLLFQEYVGKIWINDYDPAVYSFWKSVIEDTDQFVALVKSAPLTMREWNRQKEILNDPASARLDLGFALFYLNRTNRSGIVRGGVIGGKQQQGPYKLDARFNRDRLTERIQRIASYRQRIRVSCIDTADLLVNIAGWSECSPLIYLDPPYVAKGAELYRNSYYEADHRKIAQIMALHSSPWVVSYDDTELVRELYGKYSSIYYSLNYSAQDRKRGSEAMFFSPNIAPPVVSSPAQVSARDVWRYDRYSVVA